MNDLGFPLPSQALNRPNSDDPQVTDYLLKRGFTQTEKVFRRESSDLGPDGRPKHDRVDHLGPKKYAKAFILLKDWVENNLDFYKVNIVHSAIYKY